MRKKDLHRQTELCGPGAGDAVAGFRAVGVWTAVAAIWLAGCSREVRDLGPTQPQTPPEGAADPREARYQENVYQISQGGRYFAWYGCGGCHGDNAKGSLDLHSPQSGSGHSFERVYDVIANGHHGTSSGYGSQIPTEQLWQITAFVRDMPKQKPELLRRQSKDMVGEPQGSSWSGPVQ